MATKEQMPCGYGTMTCNDCLLTLKETGRTNCPSCRAPVPFQVEEILKCFDCDSFGTKNELTGLTILQSIVFFSHQTIAEEGRLQVILQKDFENRVNNIMPPIINERDVNGNTALHLAAMNKGKKRMPQ